MASPSVLSRNFLPSPLLSSPPLLISTHFSLLTLASLLYLRLSPFFVLILVLVLLLRLLHFIFPLWHPTTDWDLIVYNLRAGIRLIALVSWPGHRGEGVVVGLKCYQEAGPVHCGSPFCGSTAFAASVCELSLIRYSDSLAVEGNSIRWREVANALMRVERVAC